MTNKTDINLEEQNTEAEVALTSAEEEKIKSMVENHVFYGHLKNRTNPKMKASILSTKSGVEIIDLKKTSEQLDKAATFIKNKVKNGGNVLFVGTTPTSKFTVKETAIRTGMPYVVERWLGGTLTNFKTIRDRVNHFKKLKQDKEAGNLQKYTKKERLDIDEELIKLERFFGGIVDMDKLPSVIFIADINADDIVAREARKTGTPSVAFVNTNSDPEKVDYPIPANNRNSESVALLLSTIEKAVEEGKTARAEQEAKIKEEKENKETNV